jgi:hypothetical protein
MNTQAAEHSETHQAKQTADSFFRRHRLYICGLLAGFGLGVFSIEAFRQEKNPFLYIGGMSLIVLGSTLYRSFKSQR